MWWLALECGGVESTSTFDYVAPKLLWCGHKKCGCVTPKGAYCCGVAQYCGFAAHTVVVWTYNVVV